MNGAIGASDGASEAGSWASASAIIERLANLPEAEADPQIPGLAQELGRDPVQLTKVVADTRDTFKALEVSRIADVTPARVKQMTKRAAKAAQQVRIARSQRLWDVANELARLPNAELAVQLPIRAAVFDRPIEKLLRDVAAARLRQAGIGPQITDAQLAMLEAMREAPEAHPDQDDHGDDDESEGPPEAAEAAGEAIAAVNGHAASVDSEIIASDTKKPIANSAINGRGPSAESKAAGLPDRFLRMGADLSRLPQKEAVEQTKILAAEEGVSAEPLIAYVGELRESRDSDYQEAMGAKETPGPTNPGAPINGVDDDAVVNGHKAAPVEAEIQCEPERPQLIADGEQIARFVNALFRYAEPGTYVSFRAFDHGGGAPVFIQATPIPD
ncbi:MAG: hypothetical protein M3Y41_03630, partial [Pseudomonadota bacterium]|nr:hypothetical protein [Pseudomonadota bacterium]